MTEIGILGRKAEVSVVKGKDIEQNVRKIVELGKLLEDTIRPRDEVFIKPNLVTPTPWPVTTNPKVLEAIIKILKDLGVRKISLGDSSSWRGKPNLGTKSWRNEDIFIDTGLRKMADSLGVDLIDLDRAEFITVDIPQGIVLRKVKIPKLVLDVDAIINVPVMKTHFETLVTLGIKNLHGFLHDSFKLRYHRNDLSQKLVDILKVIRPKFTIVDGIRGIEGFGPLESGDVVEMDVLIGGKDIVAVDSVASSVMGIDPMEVETTRLANAQGIGIGELNNIIIQGESLDKVRRNFKRPNVNISGVFKGIDVIQGGVCHHCLVRARQFLEILKRDGILEATGIKMVIIGVSPRIPDGEELKDGKLLIVGNCAQFFAGSLIQMMGERCICLDGCPPVKSTYSTIDHIKANLLET